MEKELNTLKEHLLEVNDIESASAVLIWDQATYLPPEGAVARGRQLATLGKLAHEKFTDPLVGTLLDKLQNYEKELPYDSDDASLIRATRRQYEKKTKVPAAFMAEFYQHTAESYTMWIKARPNNDFKSVQSLLEVVPVDGWPEFLRQTHCSGYAYLCRQAPTKRCVCCDRSADFATGSS